jgi:three-Cys-motif partner protein
MLSRNAEHTLILNNSLQVLATGFVDAVSLNYNFLNLKSRETVPGFSDDGLSVSAAEPWFKVKVQVLQSYLQAFIVTALSRADEVVLVDLFAGSGVFSSGHQKDIFPGASFAAMGDALPFTRWIFCERDADQLKALDTRIRRSFASLDTEIVHSNPRDPDRFLSLIPTSKPGKRVAVIVLADSFSLELPFSTMNKLAALNCSLLMPFTFVLNSRMDCRYYAKEQSDMLRRYIGESCFSKLKDLESNHHFYRRLIRLYQNNLLVAGLNAAISTHRLESRMMELPAYHIGFFSKQFSTRNILREVNGAENLQYELF